VQYLKLFFFCNQKIPKSDLRGKRVVITGPTSGIGKETAKRLAAQGAHIVLASRTRSPAIEREIKDAGGSSGIVRVCFCARKKLIS